MFMRFFFAVCTRNHPCPGSQNTAQGHAVNEFPSKPCKNIFLDSEWVYEAGVFLCEPQESFVKTPKMALMEPIEGVLPFAIAIHNVVIGH